MLGCLQTSLLHGALGYWLLVTGVIGFIAMGVDKARAVGGQWRIPELTIFTIALFGGALGVGVGMILFHHKASKPGFLIIYVPILILWLAILQQEVFLGCLGTVLS